MAYKAYITNTKVNPLTLYYRPPEAQVILQVQVYPRALNQMILFADENAFKAFKEQNQFLIDGKDVIVNEAPKTKEKEAIKINEDNAIKEQKAIKSKKDKAVKNIEDSISTKNISLKTEVTRADD